MLFIEILPLLIVPMIAPEGPAIAAQPDESLAEFIAAEYSGAQRFPHGMPYVRLSHGLVQTEDSRSNGNTVNFDEGFLFAAAIGQRSPAAFGPVALDLEMELIGSRWDSSNGSRNQVVDAVTTAGLMLNAIADWTIVDRWSIYAGAGVGAAWMNIDTNDSLGNFDAEGGPLPALQARTGVEWQCTPAITLNAGFRFVRIGDAHVDDQVGNGSFDLKTRQRALEAGVRFRL